MYSFKLVLYTVFTLYIIDILIIVFQLNSLSSRNHFHTQYKGEIDNISQCTIRTTLNTINRRPLAVNIT